MLIVPKDHSTCGMPQLARIRRPRKQTFYRVARLRFVSHPADRSA
jgi:hypothetical protein